MDLNIIVEINKSRDSTEMMLNKIKKSIDLGFRIIAFNVCISYDDLKDVPHAPQVNIESLNAKNIRVLTRLTVTVEDPIQTHRLNQSETAKEYDLLAIEPLNDKILSYLNNGNFECDIITFTMTDRLPFDLKRANFSIPISRGIGLELNYAHCLGHQSKMKSVFSYGQILVDKTKGKNILLNSGAQSSFSLRSPKDVVNLGLLFGLKENQCHDAVYRNGLKVIKHSEIRRNVNMGTISLQDGNETNSWLKKEFNLNKRKCKENVENKETKKMKV